MSIIAQLVPVFSIAAAGVSLFAVAASLSALRRQKNTRERLVETLRAHDDLRQLFLDAASDGKFSADERRQLAEKFQVHLEADLQGRAEGRKNLSSKVLSLAVDHPSERFYLGLANDIGIMSSKGGRAST